MIDSHLCNEHFYMTRWAVPCEVKRLVDITQQIVQTSCDAQTGMKFILVSFHQVAKFPTNMNIIRTYPYVAQVVPTILLLYLKLTFL